MTDKQLLLNYIFMFDAGIKLKRLINEERGTNDYLLTWLGAYREQSREYASSLKYPSLSDAFGNFCWSILTTVHHQTLHLPTDDLDHEMSTVCLLHVLSSRPDILLKAVGPRVRARFVHQDALPQMRHTCDTLLARRVTARRRFLKQTVSPRPQPRRRDDTVYDFHGIFFKHKK